VSADVGEIVIIGGGIIGCMLAYDLARQGAQVTLLERQALAREASWASAGIISAPSPAYAYRQEMEQLAFRRYPTLIQEIEELSGISTSWHATGETIVGSEVDAAALRRILEWQQGFGLKVEWLDEAALREREPAVAGHYTCAIQIHEVASVLLGRVCLALARAAEHYGAEIVEHTPVLGIETQGGRATGVQTIQGSRPAGVVVVAAGAWSRMLGESLDFTIPTVPVRGQMFAVADPPIRIRTVIAGGGIYVVPRADGTVAVGATEEHDAGFAKDVSPAGLRWLAEHVDGLVPSLNESRLVASWAGLRPGTTDGRPLVGKAPHLDNVWMAAGHFRSGAMLAPGTSELLTASILAGKPDERLAAFDPARHVTG
jgi:glycine oxidase